MGPDPTAKQELCVEHGDCASGVFSRQDDTLEMRKGTKAQFEALHSEQLIILKTNTLTNL